MSLIVQPEQFSGCLVGQALADALGFVVEGQRPAACRSYVVNMLQDGRAGERGGHGWPFGQYSDDTQLARELMQSYATRGHFDPKDYAARIAAIFGDYRIVGQGRTTAAAARRLLEGVPWEEAGTPPPAAGNGSAMRAGPIGLFFADDEAQLLQTARDQGRITHQDTRCTAGAVAIAGAVALALRRGPVNVPTFAGQLAAWARPHSETTADYLFQLPGWVQLSPEDAAVPISRAGRTPDLFDRWEGISPFVTCSVLWSLYAFLRTPDDYWQTICTAIQVGGDVDTTAAMAGAISGARLGIQAIPMHLASRLTDRGTWKLDELIDLAHRCHAITTATR